VSAVEQAILSGTITNATANTLQDDSQGWATNVFASFYVRITSGLGQGQIRSITSNTSHVLTISVNWDTIPAPNDSYDVLQTTTISSAITSPLDGSGYVEVDLKTPIPAGTNSIGSVKDTTPVTITEFESYLASVAASTAETAVVSGSTTLTAGESIRFELSCQVGAAIAGQGAVYVALKGSTSNKYYAICFAGTSVAGWTYAGSAEKINIVIANGDATNAHEVGASWQAVS
jgi:hypothetical protein